MATRVLAWQLTVVGPDGNWLPDCGVQVVVTGAGAAGRLRRVERSRVTAFAGGRLHGCDSPGT